MAINLALVVGLFFALNIGASGAAASMGAAYGGKALPRRTALVLAAVFFFLGAWLGGGEVVRTVGVGIVPPEHVTATIAVAILLAAAVTLFTANLMGIPLSTSEVTVGAVVGAGVAIGAWDPERVLTIGLTWALLPPAALLLSIALSRAVVKLKRRSRCGGLPGRERALTVGLMLAGCYQAFSAGMNNVANAVGPLVGAGLLDIATAQVAGGMALAGGALLLGGRVLETNARSITDMSLIMGFIVAITAGSLVILASAHGIPVPLTQATTISIIGTGLAVNGRRGVDGRTVSRVLTVWTMSPVISLLISSWWVGWLQRARTLMIDWLIIVVWAVIVVSLVTMNRVRQQRRQAGSRGAANNFHNAETVEAQLASASERGDLHGLGDRDREPPHRPSDRCTGTRPVTCSQRTLLLPDAGRSRR